MNDFVTKQCKASSTDQIFTKHLFADDIQEQHNLVVKAVKGTRDINGQFLMAKTTESKQIKNLEKSKNRLLNKIQFQIATKKMQLNRISLLIRLRIVEGPMFVHSLLEVIRLNKHILSLQLEQGIEIPIPKQLDLKHLPLSFQYYDCILGMVRDRISSQQKHLIFKKANLKVLDPGKKPEDVEISLTEKISRYIKKNWFGMEMLSDHEYKQKLQLYEKSRSI